MGPVATPGRFVPSPRIHSMLSHRLIAPVALAAGLVLVHGPAADPDAARAGTAVRMDVEELVAHADLVVEAHVVQAQAVEGPSGRIYTDYQLLVDRTLLGQDQGVRTVRLPGGVLPDGRGMLLPGMPSLSPGQDVFLLLTEPSHDGARMPIGLSQGRFRIVRDPSGERYVVRDESGALLVGEAATETAAVSTYADMLARLEAAANAARATREGK